MKILSIVGRGYYGSKRAIEPMYFYFSEPLVQLGHEVVHFDHSATNRRLGRLGATDALARQLEESWDVVLYSNGSADPEPIDTELFESWKENTCVIAWNSDDDWRWATTGALAHHFTWMVTTYPQVYRAHRLEVPNLLLSQWGCLTSLGDPTRPKDIEFSFAGWVYKSRADECRALQRRAGLRCFGRGARVINLGIPEFPGMRRVPWLVGPPLDFSAINEIWNRTCVSFTPLTGGHETHVLSLKSRLFDMGRSGTVPLTQAAPHLADYFDLGTELVIYDNLDDCVAKARWLLEDETARRAIADAYRHRVDAEHLWTARWTRIFEDAGVKF